MLLSLGLLLIGPGQQQGMAEAAAWHRALTRWLRLVRNVPSSWNVSTSSLEQKAVRISVVLCNKRCRCELMELRGTQQDPELMGCTFNSTLIPVPLSTALVFQFMCGGLITCA